MKAKIEKFFIPMQLIILYFFDFIFKYITKTKYVFVMGVDEIANSTYMLKNIFKDKAVSVNFTVNKFYKNNHYDYSLNIKNKYLLYIVRRLYGPYLLAKLSNQSEVFVYFWWTGFCIDREIDYKFLKKKNKKIICIFLGSDIRSRELIKEYCNKHQLDTSSNYIKYNIYKNEKRVKNVARLADNYADLIFNYPKDQKSYLNSKQISSPYIITNDYLNNNDNKFIDIKTIRIVHAPSNPIGKGTPLVKAAIKKLQIEGYKFEYIELINRPNSEVLKILDSSHIVLNQFYAFIPGVFGIEAMAKYNAVLMSADYEDMPNGADNSWMKTKYWEVYDNLKHLLDNPNKIEEYAKNGHNFVKNNYTEEKVREFYVNTFYEHKIIDDKNIFSK